MEIAASNIVRSVAGRDQGKLFIVLAVEGEYLLLADGKSRKVESPKRKKRRHVLFVAADENRLSEKIRGEDRPNTAATSRKRTVTRGRGSAEREG